MILIILGIAILGWVIFKLVPYHKLRAWNEVKGIITKSDSVTFKEPQVYVNVTFIRPLIEYCYSFNGHEFKGNAISLEDHSLKENENSQNPLWSKWVKDQPCSVYVNPNNPQLSLLYPGLLPSRKYHYLALCIVAMLLIAIGSWVQYAQP